VIMAAGRGSRMKSDLPKVLHTVNGLPMITRVVHTARSLNPERIIAIIGHKSQMVENALADENIEFAYQLEQKGTGHAVEQCRDHLTGFQGDVLILSGDVPLLTAETLKSLIDLHHSSAAVCSLLSADFTDPTGYGRVIRNQNQTLSTIIEHKDATDDQLEVREINAGIYIFNAETLFRLLPLVGNNNSQGEYYLPDVISLILRENGIIAIDKTQNITEIQGVNTMQQLEKLNE